MPDRPLDWNAVVIGKGAAVPPKAILRGAANTVLTQTVVNDEPAFTKVNLGTMVTGALDLATSVTGVLPLANGGTGSAVGPLSVFGPFVGTVVPAAITSFLGIDDDVTEVNILLRCPMAGVIQRMTSQSSVAAGAGQTYIFTLRVLLADTAITHTVTGTGAAGRSGASTGSVTVALDDSISIKLVTSATAGVANHAVTLAIRATS